MYGTLIFSVNYNLLLKVLWKLCLVCCRILFVVHSLAMLWILCPVLKKVDMEQCLGLLHSLLFRTPDDSRTILRLNLLDVLF